jgi:putative hydroxymethylpyrimidine transport system ATP-binding protein
VTTPDITINSASLSYANQLIFSDIHLTIPASQWVALLGPSGIGKSSLLRLIAGLSSPQEKIQAHITTSNDIPLSQQAAYMAQNDLLLPWMTVLSNATLGMKLRNDIHNKQDHLARATFLLTQAGLGQALSLYPHQLSGGMRQRVALVRTLMEDKPVVLMDEPFSALDAITRYKLQSLAAELLKDKTVLFITHDPTEALRLANVIYIMRGQPANLKFISSLTSSTPRALSNPELTSLQTSLFDELTQAAGTAA